MIIEKIKIYFKKQIRTFGFYILLVFSISYLLFYINFQYPNDYIKSLLDGSIILFVVLWIPYFWFTVIRIFKREP